MSDYDTDILTWSEDQAALPRRLAAGELVNEALQVPAICPLTLDALLDPSHDLLPTQPPGAGTGSTQGEPP